MYLCAHPSLYREGGCYQPIPPTAPAGPGLVPVLMLNCLWLPDCPFYCSTDWEWPCQYNHIVLFISVVTSAVSTGLPSPSLLFAMPCSRSCPGDICTGICNSGVDCPNISEGSACCTIHPDCLRLLTSGCPLQTMSPCSKNDLSLSTLDVLPAGLEGMSQKLPSTGTDHGLGIFEAINTRPSCLPAAGMIQAGLPWMYFQLAWRGWAKSYPVLALTMGWGYLKL